MKDNLIIKFLDRIYDKADAIWDLCREASDEFVYKYQTSLSHLYDNQTVSIPVSDIKRIIDDLSKITDELEQLQDDTLNYIHEIEFPQLKGDAKTNLAQKTRNEPVRYIIKYNGNLICPELVSIRRLPLEVFKFLYKIGKVNELNYNLFSPYIKTDREGDNKYEQISGNLYVSIQHNRESIKLFKSLLYKHFSNSFEIMPTDPFPTTCGVYKLQLTNSQGLELFGNRASEIKESLRDRVLYVGLSKNLHARINTHFKSTRNSALRRNIAQALGMKFTTQYGKTGLKDSNEQIITEWLLSSTEFTATATDTIEEAQEISNNWLNDYNPYFNEGVKQ